MYEANRDQNTIVVNTLEAPIKARFIRLEPQEWYGHISMRMELYGCSLKSGILCLFFYYDCFKVFSNLKNRENHDRDAVFMSECLILTTDNGFLRSRLTGGEFKHDVYGRQQRLPLIFFLFLWCSIKSHK